MDKVKALDLEQTLKGREVGGYIIEKIINFGKSAAVFRATDSGDAPAAVKIFDDELIEKYGDSTQLARIDRELTLVGHDHPYLVKILAGGFDPLSKNHYIVMEYLDGPNLKDSLKNVPNEVVPSLIQQLASAAKFLENRNLAHRDIKPENIVLLDGCKRLVLLDLGVLRPIGEAGLTDGEAIRAFVGTLQYSSPEFLLRNEEDSIEGWRALTFYQIGGVIHDLVMRRALFDEFVNPYARLVMAVQEEIPVIESASAPAYLVDLANRCLLKNPILRTRFVSWADFEAPSVSPLPSAKDIVVRRIALARASQDVGERKDVVVISQAELKRTIIGYLKVAARSIRNSVATLPPITTTIHPSDNPGICVAFAPSAAHQLPHGLFIYVQVEILDAPAKVVVIRGCACLQKLRTTKLLTEHVVFQGIYEGANVYKSFEEFIYSAISWAQSGLHSSKEFWPPPDGGDC